MVHKPTTLTQHYTMADIHNFETINTLPIEVIEELPTPEHALPLHVDQPDANIDLDQPTVNMEATFVMPKENNEVFLEEDDEDDGDYVEDNEVFPEDDEDDEDYVEENDPEVTVSPFTQTHVNLLVKPYIDALAHADSKEGILQWLPLVFEADYLEDALTAVAKAEDVETAINEVITIMTDSLIDEAQQKAGDSITPWDIANARDQQLTKLFGEPSKVLPVNVTVGPNVYTHNLSQDCVYGILNVLAGNKQFNITLNGTQIPLEELQLNYTAPKDFSYKAILPQGAVFFNSPDVIQGVMTAAQWINTDAHTFVKELNGFIDGKWVPLNF